MLQEQPLPVIFGGGVDTETDRKSVALTKLLDLQNATFKAGALVKRPGYEALSTLVDTTGVSYGTPVGLAALEDEVITFSNGRAYSYRESADLWSLSGEVSSVIATSPPIARTGTVQAIPDVAIRNGIQVVAWEDSRGGVWCSVLEEESGRILLSQTQLDANGRNPRCVYSGSSLLVLWTVQASHSLMCAVVNTALPSAAPVINILASDLSPTNPAYDAESFGPQTEVNDLSSEPAVVAWALDSVGYKVGYISQAGVLGSVTVGLPGVAQWSDSVDGPIAVTIGHAETVVAVLWHFGQVRVRFHEGLDLTDEIRTAALGTPGTDAIRLVARFGKIVLPDDYSLWWAVQRSPTRTDLSVIHAGRASLGLTVWDATETILMGHELVTRAFYDGEELSGDALPTGDVYVMVASGARFFSYVAAIRLSSDAGITGGQVTCVARMLPGEAPASHFRRISAGPSGFERIKHVSSVVDRDRQPLDSYSRRHAMPLSYQIQLASRDGDQFSEIGIKYVTLDFDADVSYQSAQLGRGLYLASACPQHYDRDRWCEAGYHGAPDWGYEANGSPYAPLSAFSSFGGGSIPNGTHLYKIWYEDIDAQGETHPGPVSAPVLVTTSGGNGTVRITIPTYKLTNKRRVRICVARAITDAEGEDETIAYYRVTGLDPAVTTGANCMVFSDPTLHYVLFDDALSDTALLARVPLYTNGGIRSNDPAPWAGGVIAVGKSRLFWTDPTDPMLVRYSKTINDDTAIEAPVSFSLRCDPYGGPIRAIWVMDESVYIGKRDAVFSFGGPGPEDAPDVAPERNLFTDPVLVTTDAGVESPASVGLVPIGTILKAKKGIVLLDRSRQVVPIGKPVDGFKEQDVTRTLLLPGRPHIVMLSSSGSTLLFDYERGQWGRYTNHEGWGAVVVNERYYYLRTDGQVYRETPGAYRDHFNHVPMRIDTAWIKMSGYLQGLQSIIWAYFLGTFKSRHTLRVWFQLDYSDAWLGPIDMDVNTNFDPRLYGEGLYGEGLYGTGDVDPAALYQRRCHLNQHGQAIRFRIEDVEAADDYGAAFELSEMLLVGGVLGPRNMTGAARSS